LAEFVRRLVFNAAIGNADMHLKNWSLIYRDGKTPELAPGYDFVSTIQYSSFDERMALSMAKEKDPQYLDIELLERFAIRARVPSMLVIETGLEAAERTVKAWLQLKSELPLDAKSRERINQQLKYVPITRRFLPGSLATTRPARTIRKRTVRRSNWSR
jgi:serine/threonine-protein kinase HipA